MSLLCRKCFLKTIVKEMIVFNYFELYKYLNNRTERINYFL